MSLFFAACFLIRAFNCSVIKEERRKRVIRSTTDVGGRASRFQWLKEESHGVIIHNRVHYTWKALEQKDTHTHIMWKRFKREISVLAAHGRWEIFPSQADSTDLMSAVNHPYKVLSHYQPLLVVVDCSGSNFHFSCSGKTILNFPNGSLYP